MYTCKSDGHKIQPLSDGTVRLIYKIQSILGEKVTLRCHRDENGRVWPPTSASLMMQFTVADLEQVFGLDVSILDADGEVLSAEAYQQLMNERSRDLEEMTHAQSSPVASDPEAPDVQPPAGDGPLAAS